MLVWSLVILVCTIAILAWLANCKPGEASSTLADDDEWMDFYDWG